MHRNEFEDRQNDWLAQEMAREGYVNNTSGLEKDHEKHEKSKDWDAGAVSNARQHEILHQKYSRLEKVGNTKNSKTLTTLVVIIILFVYFLIGVISALIK